MRGNWVEFTSTTGGTGALTLTELAGFPSVQDIVGTTGSRWLGYTILEWSNGVYAGPPAKAEHGIGSLALATGVLTRTKRLSTWNGTDYETINPSAISFGTTANNIRVVLAPTAELNPDVLPFYNVASPAEALGLTSSHATVGSATLALGASGREHYVPFRWCGCGDATHVGLAVTTSQGSTAAKIGFYAVDSTGLPGARLIDATGASPVTTAATGPQVSACSFHLPTGWYYACVLGNSTTAAVRAFENRGAPSMAGTNTTGGALGYFTATGNYATGLPATAPAGASLTAATTGGPCVYLRPRN